MEGFRKGSRDQEGVMMAYTVIIENKAQKDFFRLLPPYDHQVKKAINGIEDEPRPHGVKNFPAQRMVTVFA